MKHQDTERFSWKHASPGLMIAYAGILFAVVLGIWLNHRTVDTLRQSSIRASYERCLVMRDSRTSLRTVIQQDHPRSLLELAPPIVCEQNSEGLWVPKEEPELKSKGR